MKRTPLLFITIFLIISPAVMASSLEFKENKDELWITIPSPEYFNPSNMKVFLCKDSCNQEQIKSISYGGYKIDFFIEPEHPGDYTLKVFFADDETYYEENINVKNGHKRETVERIGLTANVIKNASSPIFVLAFLSIFVIFAIFKHGDILKNNPSNLLNAKTKALILFIFVFVFLSSATHELSHILTAGIFNCPASLDSFIPILTPTSVSFSCSSSVAESVVILASGLIGNLIIGTLILVINLRKKSAFISIISFAFFSSSFFYLFYNTGDIHNIMRMLNFFVPQLYLNLAGIFTITSSFYAFFRNIART